MRELIDILDKILIESQVDEAANLAASEILSRTGRFEKFIDHIKNKRPFYTHDDQEVIVDPSEADRFMDMYTQKQFTGNIKARDINGQFWPLSQFKKTGDFGGSAVKPTEVGDMSKMSKDAAKLKPAEIGITGKDISASELGSLIVNNSALQATEWGRAVIQMANDIMAGAPALIPEDIRKYEPIVKAIVDNAGEYLGVLALVSGQSQWYGGMTKKKEFVRWLGSDLDGLTINFPAGQTTALADSFATVSNLATGHTLNISSKGTGGGAAPALSTMKIPESVKRNPKYKTAVELLDLCASEGAATVGFHVMNLLYQNDPKSIPSEYKGLLPWKDNVIAAAQQSMKTEAPLPEKYQKIVDSVKSKAPDGGKLMYAIKRDVAKMVNSGALPEYEAAMLEVLDYNFIQQYATFQGKKSGVVDFATQWPAKIDGEVSMENKSSANEPGSGGFSFKLHPKGTPMRVDPESGDVEDTEQPMDIAPAKTSSDDLDAVTQKRSGIKAAGMTTAPLGAREPIGDKQSLGRERRRR
jgi:hypothetical protein